MRDLHEMEDAAGVGVRDGRDDELNYPRTAPNIDGTCATIGDHRLSLT